MDRLAALRLKIEALFHAKRALSARSPLPTAAVAQIDSQIQELQELIYRLFGQASISPLGPNTEKNLRQRIESLNSSIARSDTVDSILKRANSLMEVGPHGPGGGPDD